MKNNIISSIFLLFFFMNIQLSYADVFQASLCAPVTIKSVDVNKDGKNDVTYYGDGKNVTKVEADTNYNSKPDVVVHIENGKFKSAEADTDHNGSMETKFNDYRAFKDWVNKTNPDFAKELNRPDWEWKLLEF